MEGISTSSLNVTIEGKELLKDQTKNTTIYATYIKSVVSDPASFIKPELTGIVEAIMPTMSPKSFKTVLEDMVVQASKKARTDLDALLTDVLVHMFSYIKQNRQTMANINDLPTVLGRLKGTYTSSRNTDPLLLRLRRDIEVMVRRVTKINHSGSVAAIRTGVLLYVVLRALTKDHYSR